MMLDYVGYLFLVVLVAVRNTHGQYDTDNDSNRRPDADGDPALLILGHKLPSPARSTRLTKLNHNTGDAKRWQPNDGHSFTASDFEEK